MTIRDLIQMEIDIDVYDDVYDDVCEELAIAFCGPMKLTPEGEAQFASIMDFPVTINRNSYDGLPAAIVGVDDPEEEVWLKRLKEAKRFFESAAGYCSCDDYDRWFKEAE